MEKELNISAILKDKPEGTKLWSPIFGNCKFSRLSGSGIIVFPIHNGFTSIEEKYFFVTGQNTLAGEVLLFPSKEMRDWEKFAWKKGDVLLNDDGKFCIFESFAHSSYSTFKSKLIKHEGPFKKFDTFLADTKDWHKASDDVVKEYIVEIEEVEEQPEFKDGDILYMNGCHLIYIFKKKVQKSAATLYYTSLDADYNSLYYNNAMEDVHGSRLATEEEKQQLFDALAKEGKRWNPDTKKIEDLSKGYEFKAFDKVLVRDFDDREWKADFFSHNRLVDDSDYRFSCVGNMWRHCIPYNEETKHLLGTTDEWKGGE
jgi:hypothetical protein